MKNLEKVSQWIDVPTINITYFCIICYFTIFSFSYLLFCLLLVSIFSFVWHNGIKSTAKLLVILVSFSSICLMSLLKENQAIKQNRPVTTIKPILDTIQVNGDQVAFKAKASGNTYQVYYQVSSKEEKQFFQRLDQPIQLKIASSLEKAPSARNMHGFDFRNYLKTQRIYYILTINDIQEITKVNDWQFNQVRRRLLLFCEQQFPRPLSTYMMGMIFGYFDKSFDEMATSYTSLGMVHLFSLSGMQVYFLLTVFRNSLLRLGIRRDKVTVLQIPVVILYVMLSGLSVSIVRAGCQKLFSSFGFSATASFSLSLGVLFLLMPKFLLTTGGTLTCCFGFVIMMLGDRIRSETNVYRKLILRGLLPFALLPILSFFFYSFQPLSIIFVILFNVVVSRLLFPCLFSLFLLAISTGMTFNEVNYLFVLFEHVIKQVVKWSPSPIVLGKPSPLFLLLMLMSIGVLIDNWQDKKYRYGLLLSLVIMLLLTKYPMTESITVLDVGQGDSILLQDRFNQHTVLIDTGGELAFTPSEKWQKRTKLSNAERTLIPYLKSLGLGQIDTLVITHTDADHMGDLLKVVSQINVKKIVVSQGSLTNQTFVTRLKQTKSKIQVAKVGQRFPLFDSYLEVIYPTKIGDGKNNDSIVLYGEFYQTKFLFTGDLESEGEAEVLANYPSLNIDVLKLGHHGSKTSSSEQFIKKLNPSIGLISCGLNNRYNHPHQDTLRICWDHHMTIYRTDRQGAIKFEKKGKSWKINTVK